MSDVNLSISQDVVKPIIEAQVKSAIAQALGSSDKIITDVVNAVIELKVDESGKVNRDSYYNKYNYIDVKIKESIHKAINEAFDEWLGANKDKIKSAMIKQLDSTKSAKKLTQQFIKGLIDSVQFHRYISVNVNIKEDDNN